MVNSADVKGVYKKLWNGNIPLRGHFAYLVKDTVLLDENNRWRVLDMDTSAGCVFDIQLW